jgi:Tat protein translocase TatB subunit
LFEVGFSELLVIAVVALLVLGPERLPRAARMAGSFMRKARNSFEGLKAEVESVWPNSSVNTPTLATRFASRLTNRSRPLNRNPKLGWSRPAQIWMHLRQMIKLLTLMRMRPRRLPIKAFRAMIPIPCAHERR